MSAMRQEICLLYVRGLMSLNMGIAVVMPVPKHAGNRRVCIKHSKSTNPAGGITRAFSLETYEKGSSSVGCSLVYLSPFFLLYLETFSGTLPLVPIFLLLVPSMPTLLYMPQTWD